MISSPPVLLDIPQEIETERLMLRAPAVGDGAVVNAAVVESIAELRPWLPWAKVCPTVADSEAFCRRGRADFTLREDLPLLIFHKQKGSFVGGSGLHRIDWSVPAVEIGYWCRSTEIGRGYISEAVRAVSRYAFRSLRAKRVEIRTDDCNERSWRIAESCGFQLEGVLRRHCLGVDGSLRSIRVYSILAESELTLGGSRD